MIFKVMASVLIVFGCTYLGVLLAIRSKQRMFQLIEFENALSRLELDIDFLSIPLSESFKRISKSCTGVVGDVFKYIYEEMKDNHCCNIKNLWGRARRRYWEKILISDDDIKILDDFFKNLGSGDKEREKNNIKITLMRLSAAENDAKLNADKNGRMYKEIGTLCGIFIVILLI